MQKGVDYIGVGTGAMIFNDCGQVFIARRGPKARSEGGKWDFPGGSVEYGEKCADAIIREIKEEFDIEILELLEVVDHILPEENQHWVSPTFIARIKSGEPKIMEPEKCMEIKWVTLEDVEQHSLTMPSTADIKIYKKRFGYKPPNS